jgi:CBS domain containing-hemolysin-like protein
MGLSPLISILIILSLVLANGFFVAAEFALVSSRPTRIQQLAAGGNMAARLVQRAQADPNRFIAAAQLGITVASLLLGWLGEETFAAFLHPVLALVLADEGAWLTAHGVASILALTLITFLHIALGEQVPKMLALQHAESVILIAAPLTDLIARLFRPFIAVLYLFTNFVLRLLGLEYRAEEHAVHSPDELRLLVGRTASAGLISPSHRELVERAFAFGDLTAAEVMVPRTEVVALATDTPMREAIRTVLRTRHSRYPVYETSVDNVVGVLPAKSLLALAARGRLQHLGPDSEESLKRLLRAPLFVPQGTLVADLLTRMKAARQPLAVVLDEFGGTSGVVTARDLLARLGGEIGDEDGSPTHEIRSLEDGTVLADGLALLEDINERLGTRFDAAEVDTLGGLVFARLGRRPRIGDDVELDGGYHGVVDRLDGLRIARVRLIPPVPL